MDSNPQLLTKPRIFNKPCPKIEREIIGWMDLPNLKFAKNIRDCYVHYDLNHLYNERIIKPDILDPKLENLLQFLQQFESSLNFSTPRNLSDSTFFCTRGLLTSMCSTPYENKEPWKIAVMLFKGNIYMCLRHTKEKLTRLAATTEEQRKNGASGFKFEQFLFSDTPDSEPNPDKPCDEFEEFSLIYHTTLSKHKIVFRAEMDGVACDKNNIKLPTNNATYEENIQFFQQSEFVEAKTNLHFDNNDGVKNMFRVTKSGKWWCQSYLVGIDRIICGFKNMNRVVEELKVFTLDEIKSMSSWDTNVCINFLDSFLSYVKECLKCVISRKFGTQALNNIQELGLVTLLLERAPRGNVKMSQNWNHDVDEILSESFRNSFGNIQQFDSYDKIKELKDENDNTCGNPDETLRSSYDGILYGNSSEQGYRERFYDPSRNKIKNWREKNKLTHPSDTSDLKRTDDITESWRANNMYGHPSDKFNSESSYDKTETLRANNNTYTRPSNTGHRERSGNKTERWRGDNNMYGHPSDKVNSESSYNKTETWRANNNTYTRPSNTGHRERSGNKTERWRGDNNKYGHPSDNVHSMGPRNQT